MIACRWVWLLFAAVLSLAFAPAPLPRAERRGPALGPDMVGEWSRLKITATHLSYSPGCTYELRVDRAARPARYDITGYAGGGTAGADWLGIYKVEGDVLTLCYNPAKQGRPTAFEGPGKGQFTETYRRSGR